MNLAHRIRLDPTPEQASYLRRACGTARFTYNWALAVWKAAYEAGEKPSGLGLKKRFNAIRRDEFPWTYDVHRDCTAQPFANLQKAFTAFFANLKAKRPAGYPTFKKRGQHDSFYIANDKLTVIGDRVRIPVLGWVRMREGLRFEGKILSATVSRQADRWFISISVEVADYAKLRTGDGVVGVDLGIKSFAVTSEGEVIDGPRPLRSGLVKLRRLSKAHSRKRRGSKNRAKSAMVLARHHARVSDLRSDFLHKLSTRLCRENQAVVVEDLHVKGMLRNRRLSRAIADAGWGEFRRQLEYKAAIYGTTVVIAPRFYPSSKTCSGCGSVKSTLLLSERTYQCEHCGLFLGRDFNAALNLAALGLRVTACGEASSGREPCPAKLASVKQEPSTRAHLCARKG